MKKLTLSQELQGDKQIWYIAALLCFVSIVAVYSSVAGLAARSVSPEIITLKHTLYLGIGIVVMYFIHRVEFFELVPYAKLLLYISPFLLLYTLVGGKEIGGAKRWISIMGITFQTSDFIRLVLITNLAAMLASKQNSQYTWRSFIPIFIWCGGICGLLAFSSFSTAIILGVTCVLIMWIGRIPLKYLLTTSAVVLVCLMTTMLISWGMGKYYGAETGRFQTAVDRIEAFSGADIDGNGLIGGYVGSTSTQMDEALLAISRGGIFGRGPGNSALKYRLPEAYSDFIFSIIVEEYGLLGALTVMAAYIWLLSRGFYLVRHSTRPFAGLLSIGLTLSIVFQAFAHMFINVGLGPVTGQTLPMISKGGTSILFTAIALGIVLSVSKVELGSALNQRQ